MVKKVFRLLAKGMVFFTFFPHSISHLDESDEKIK